MATARELLEQADALMRRNRAQLDDAGIPELTDVVVDFGPESAGASVAATDGWKTGGTLGDSELGPPSIDAIAEGEPSVWLDETAFGEASITGTPPDSVIVVPATTPEMRADARIAELARWEALAEEIRMQVLQRIDIFTDTGLKEQLVERLRPEVDRASTELAGTISLHVGELLRAYVAEAIEREIEQWRRRNVPCSTSSESSTDTAR